ncbi:MAG: hypothetical protein Q4E76_05120 [Tissierellia bacterium]|nr:hypothetical protein [Tissierellia bacterium]
MTKDQWTLVQFENVQGVVTMIDSLIDEHFIQPDERLLEVLEELMPLSDLNTWLLFDVEENREMTEIFCRDATDINGEGQWLWISRELMVALFDSYLSLYTVLEGGGEGHRLVNHATDEIVMVEKLGADLDIGDTFFGRVVALEGKNYLFSNAHHHRGEQARDIRATFEEIYGERHLEVDWSYSDGNPELLYLYILTLQEVLGDFSHPGGRDGSDLTRMAKELFSPEDAEDVIHLLDCMEDEFHSLTDRRSIFLDPEFTQFDHILRESARRGNFYSDQLAYSILKLFDRVKEIRGIEGESPSPFELKALLEASTLGFYLRGELERILADVPVTAPLVRYFPKFIDFLEMEEDYLTPRFNLKIWAVKALRAKFPAGRQRNTRRVEERHVPILLIMKKFAFHKGLVFPWVGEVELRFRYKFYDYLSQSQQWNLWISTFFHPEFERDKLPSGVSFGPLTELYESYLRRFGQGERIVVPLDQVKSKEDFLVTEIFGGLGLFTEALTQESQVMEVSELGKEVLRYFGLWEAEERDNMIPLF